MRRDNPWDRMAADIEDAARRFADSMEAGAERMSHRWEARRDRYERRMERRAARRAAGYACWGAPRAYWWMIFPLVFWVLPSLSRGGWSHGQSWRERQDWHGWSGSFDGAGGFVRGWIDAGPAGWAIDGFAALTGFSQGNAAALLVMGGLTCAVALGFALTRPLSPRRRPV